MSTCAPTATQSAPRGPALADLDLTFAYSLCGFALLLLLVFRVNTSYARYWEGALACSFSRHETGACEVNAAVNSTRVLACACFGPLQ